MDPPERPLWIGDAANDILEKWDEWKAEAEQQAQVEQNDEASQYIMLAKLEQCIAAAFQKDHPKKIAD